MYGTKALTRTGSVMGKLVKCSAERAKDMEQQECSDPSSGHDKGTRDVEVDKIPFRPYLEAKLIQLVHHICVHEIKLCSDAAKEFVKVLKGESGSNLLRLYFHHSPNFAELVEAWKLRHDKKQGLSYIFKLIHTILSHPEGKGRSTYIGRALDGFARLIFRTKLDDIYKALNSNEGKQQNAALLLLASIVRRGPDLASEVAKKFSFKGFAKLGEFKTLGARKAAKHSTRRAFVAFAISFLEVGRPRLLGSVIQQKEMYFKVLQGLGKDDEDTVASVLSTLNDKILVKESLVSPALRSVLFGDATLEQLASISAREDDVIVNELAHHVLLKVCTDPCNGLMPDANRNFKGNSDRLLKLMKKLRAIEFRYHLDLLLAIVRRRPSLASAFLDIFPYNVENLASPSWVSSISLAANLVSSVRSSCSLDFLNPDQCATPPSVGSDVQTIMKCICPRPFSRSLITKGMLHSDFLVKNGTLRLLLEMLRLLDSFVKAWKLCLSHSCSAEKIQASLERDVMAEVKSFFPDSQVLLTVLKPLGGTETLSLKRKAVLDSGLVDRKKCFKRSEKVALEEEAGDIIIAGVTSGKDIFLTEDPVDAQMTDQDDAEKEYLGIVSDIWGSEFCSKPINSVEEADMWFHIKLLDVLRIYVRSVPNGVEGSFDFFMKLLSSPSAYPAEFQRALLSLLNEYISWTPKSQIEKVPPKIPPLMYKHLHLFVNLLLFSSDNKVRDLAKNLAVVAMSSTGAFDQNPSEIGAWFLFLPGPGKIKPPLKVQEAVQSMPSVLIFFLCNAVRTVGKNLFEQQYWDIIKSSLSHFKGVSIGFSPLIVCVLQNCVKLISESTKHSLAEKTEISLYVCSTLKYILQTQVDSRPLSCVVQSVLSKEFDGSKDFLCEWRPLRMLLLFSQSWSDKKPFIRTAGLLPDTTFVSTLDKIKGLVRTISSDQDEFAGTVKAFSSSLICATPESILKNIDSVMAISWDLYGASFSVLQSIAFLNENFLSPDLFVPSPERNLREGTVCSEIDFADGSSVTEEIKSKIAFFRFSEQMPFPVLLNTIMRMDISCLPEFPITAELLLLKVLQPESDNIEPDIQLILNWLLQIRSSYKVQPAPELCQLSEICLRLMKHLYSQISEQDLVSSGKLLVNRVVCHPVVIALLESPLDCGTLPRLQNVSETSLTVSRLVISEIDQQILDLLVLTCEHLLFDERHIGQKGDLKSIIAIKELVERLILVFRSKFELCVGSQSYASLLQPSQLIHALLRFISPVKLLYLVRSMLSKFDEEELASPNSSMLISLGLYIAGGAFEMLTLYSQQPAAKRGVYDLLWEFEENNYDSNLFEEVYSLACRFSTSFGLASADTCLLKFGVGFFRGKHSIHPLTVIISQIVGRTPKDLIIHCVNKVSMTRAKILFYLVESSPLHLSLFGHFFFRKEQNDLALTDDQFIMLLPAVLSYLKSVIAKLEKPCSRCLDITSVYSNILVNGCLQWPTFCSGCVFEEKYEEILLSTAQEDIESMFKASHLGRAVSMFQYHFSLTESPTKTDDLLKVFYAMFPRTSAGKEMLDYEIKKVDIQSADDMFNVAIRVVAKVELSRICLFPEDFEVEAGSCVNRESLLNALVNSWQSVVKRSDGSFKGKQEKCWFLCKRLENFILTSILKFLKDMCEELVHLDSLPFLERLMKSVLLYRFEDSETLKILREIFSLLSRGKCSYAPYIQLLISHSHFTSTISSLSSHTGEIFRPISSILEHFIISTPTSVRVGSCRLEALEIVKLVRVLISKCGKNSGINLKELHFLLLCSYGATLSEIDLELHKLMHEIELIDDEQRLNVSETDYLWGKSALKMREGLNFALDASDSSGEAELMEELRQSLFKENLCVDPKICALTVLCFPYQHTAESSDNSHLYDNPISEKCSAVIERYDSAFILRFSIHSLSMRYIEPVEFASLGLLAVAFVSVSSADLGMRKLGYKTLEIYLDALEGCRENKETVKRLGLLLMYVQNGVKKQWHRIPTVYAVFAAEASLILLDSSHEHFVPIIERLKKSSTPKGIPLFHEFFCTSGFRSQRLWELRLVYLGLKSEDDAEIYKEYENSVLERVMSFFSSPLTDDETRGLILKVVRKSVKFHIMAEHLVKKCGLLSWCSSFISMFTTKLTGDEDSRFILVLEVITDALASRSVAKWLQEEAVEGLMEISSCLQRLLGAGFVSVQEHGTSVDLILQILSATLRMSRERTMNKPHFTITIDGIFQLFEAVTNSNSPQVKAIAERGLHTILSCTPQCDIICMDVDKLRRFLMWGTSTALKSDFEKGSKPSISRQDTKTLTEEAQDETMVAKFLRWLLASVILGKLYSKANDTERTILSEEKPETLLTLLEYFKNLGGSMTNSECVIGEVILHLQKLSCTNYRALLPSVVCALSLILLSNGLGTAGTESKGDYKLIKSLCSRISSPPEASPAWRWSYDRAWKYPSSEPATDQEKIDVLHACQHLILMFSDMLGETPRESKQVLLSESFDLSSVFEWERCLLET